MRDPTDRSSASALVTWSRYVLLALALLFVVGAVVQVFLAGLGLFDDAERWDDHTNMGHMIGLITYVLWIPAVLARAGLRVIVGTVVLFVLFGLQYAFIETDNTTLNALHPVNALALFTLSGWIALRAFGLIRRTPGDASLATAPQ